jgi:hypothetical protein
MVAIVDVKSAAMPAKVKAAYVRIRVLDVRYDLAAQHKMGKWAPQSVNSKAVNRVIGTWGPVPASGRTMRSGYQQALAEARDVAQQYNNAGDAATTEQIIGAGGSA